MSTFYLEIYIIYYRDYGMHTSWKKCAVLQYTTVAGKLIHHHPKKLTRESEDKRRPSKELLNVAKSTCNPSHPKIDIWLGMPCQRQFRSL